jgi:hypothetical protein
MVVTTELGHLVGTRDIADIATAVNREKCFLLQVASS